MSELTEDQRRAINDIITPERLSQLIGEVEAEAAKGAAGDRFPALLVANILAALNTERSMTQVLGGCLWRLQLLERQGGPPDHWSFAWRQARKWLEAIGWDLEPAKPEEDA